MGLKERGMKIISAEIKPEANEALESLAKAKQTSKSTVIRWAIEHYLARVRMDNAS